MLVEFFLLTQWMRTGRTPVRSADILRNTHTHTQAKTRTHGTQMQFMAGIREFAAQCSGRRDEVITSISTTVGAAIKSYLSNRARQ